jgi:2-aminoadipate transaminase
MTATGWTERYAERTRYERDPAIWEILQLTQKPNMISFAGGIPAAEFFPTERIREATERVLADGLATKALQYGPTEGYDPLRQLIAEQMHSMGVPCTIDNILITSGSQQSLDLLGKVLIDPGDGVIVEDPTYLGMLDAWRVYGAAYCVIEADEYGTDPYSLQHALASAPAKLIYLVPNFNNPTGVTTTEARRAEIVRMARQHGVCIIEDDPYGKLRYEGDDLPPLMALDAELAGPNGSDPLGHSNVIYLSTFSKTLCPGFRIGWIVASAELIRYLTDLKLNADLHTSTFAQLVVYEVAKDGFLQEHITYLRQQYRERRDLMLALIEEMFPPNVTWNRPEGGLFLWVKLPENVDAGRLLRHAADDHGVAYVPGRPFYPHGGVHNTLRLNFSYASPEKIEEGVKRLAEVVRHACEPV